MQNQLNQITSAVAPFLSSPIGHAVAGLALLVVGLLVKNLVVRAFRTALKRLMKGGAPTDELASALVGLFNAVLTVLVLVAVLDHFKLSSVLEPLKIMVAKFTGALPNIVGAGVIAYAGWLIAKIVSQSAEFALKKVDDALKARSDESIPPIAPFGSAFVFGAVLLPVIVSALGVLNIDAISVPMSQLIGKLMSAVPNIVGAACILLVTYYATRFVTFMLDGLLVGFNVDALPAKLGVSGQLFNERFTPRKFIRGAIMFFAMLAAATAAVEMLNIRLISEVFARVLEFGGGLLVGTTILIIGNFLGTLAHDKLSAHGSKSLANIARVAILGLVLAMGLKAMGLADSIVTMAFGFTLGSVAVAAALAFGLGGRDAAKTLTERWVRPSK